MSRYVLRRVLGALAVAATFALLGWLTGAIPAEGEAEAIIWAPGPLGAPAEPPGAVLVLGHCDPGFIHDDEANDPETDPCIEEPEPEPEPEPEGCDELAGLYDDPDPEGEGCVLRSVVELDVVTERKGLFALSMLVALGSAVLVSQVGRR